MCGPSQVLPCIPSSAGRVRAHSPGLFQTSVCPSVSQPPSRPPGQGLITQRTGRHSSSPAGRQPGRRASPLKVGVGPLASLPGGPACPLLAGQLISRSCVLSI